MAEHAYNNSASNAHGMSPFYANYGFHPQTEWMKERRAQDPGAELYAHWMQTTHQRAKKALEKTRQDMSKYYDRKARQQPDIKVGYLVMLNAKNIRTKQPMKKIKSTTPWSVQSIGSQERGTNVQTGDLSKMEDSSSISCIATGTMPSISMRRKGTSTTRT